MNGFHFGRPGSGRAMGTLLPAITLLAVLGLGMSPGAEARLLTTAAGSTGPRISQVYGGGGNSGAPYRNDYVELFNPSTTTVSLAGWSLQYASAAGPGDFGGTSAELTELFGSLAPGQYLL